MFSTIGNKPEFGETRVENTSAPSSHSKRDKEIILPSTFRESKGGGLLGPNTAIEASIRINLEEKKCTINGGKVIQFNIESFKTPRAAAQFLAMQIINSLNKSGMRSLAPSRFANKLTDALDGSFPKNPNTALSISLTERKLNDSGYRTWITVNNGKSSKFICYEGGASSLNRQDELAQVKSSNPVLDSSFDAEDNIVSQSGPLVFRDSALAFLRKAAENPEGGLEPGQYAFSFNDLQNVLSSEESEALQKSLLVDQYNALRQRKYVEYGVDTSSSNSELRPDIETEVGSFEEFVELARFNNFVVTVKEKASDLQSAGFITVASIECSVDLSLTNINSESPVPIRVDNRAFANDRNNLPD